MFQHRIFVRALKKIIHSCGGSFGKWFKEWRTQTYATLKNLKDNIHAIGFYLQYSLSKELHELSQGLILLHFYVLQGTDILLMSSWAQVLPHEGFWQIPEIINQIHGEPMKPWESLALEAGGEDFA